MFIFWILIIVAVLFFVYWLFENGKIGGREDITFESALDILKKRYARGEIDKKQFESMRRDIDSE